MPNPHAITTEQMGDGLKREGGREGGREGRKAPPVEFDQNFSPVMRSYMST